MTKIEEILFERFSLTEDLYQEYLNKFIKDGVLKDFPSKETPRVCIFIYCSRMFEFDKEYSELAVNFKLKPFYKDDFVLIRRSMVDYGLLSRTPDGTKYVRNK
ncbi:MAG: DUF2087 domain-containing protein [Bacilli bacterium]|nr:DUF2087 domain-containing protein [Bacilli bacterium]